MSSQSHNGRITLPALTVHQWLNEWDRLEFDARAHRRRPDPQFYLFSMNAADLKALTGIQRRTRAGDQDEPALGIQRRHEPGRSDEIQRFVRYGYPWSELNEARRLSGEFDDLRKPGWLPTAIVVNILTANDVREGKRVAAGDLLNVEQLNGRMAEIHLPTTFHNANWFPSGQHPLEVIDGQHRLWAFENTKFSDFELPVVAFHGLDLSWQAYLFWTINIRPKRINASLAFDLYPLLRAEDWLERVEEIQIYRQTRSQELCEALWAHQPRASPTRRPSLRARVRMASSPRPRAAAIAMVGCTPRWVST
jgi:hypothetical protein